MRLVLFMLLAVLSHAQERKNFAAALSGLAILSGDAATELGPNPAASSYSARQGLNLNLAAGRHFNDWISVQANYIWNRNDVNLEGVRSNAFYSSVNRSRQHQFVLDALVYFRPLSSRIRPYLSAGVGPVRVSRAQTALNTSTPAPSLPDRAAAAWYPGLRVAVGADLLLRNGWGFRYSFSETLTPNLFSKSLRPAASKNLMNFHHLFGAVKYF
jgi:outer membrane protein W